eukprot:5700847-Ditylum_brightwellii.AAC.1
MEESIEVKESKSNGDGGVWASSYSRVKPVSSKEHTHTSIEGSFEGEACFLKGAKANLSMEGSFEVKESKSNRDGEVWASSHS